MILKTILYNTNKAVPYLVFLFLTVGLFLYIFLGNSSPVKNISIRIDGAVKSPGTFEFPKGSILNDLISKAEGFDPYYDKEYVQDKLNLTRKLDDGEKIYIPFDKSTPDESIRKININFADIDLLDNLPGIGNVTAQKIIDNRPYRTIDDLLIKKSVTKTIYDKIKSWIEV